MSTARGTLRIPTTPLQSRGLGDGKDSGISLLCGDHWESPGLPCSSRDWGWERQWDFSAVWRTLGIPGTPLQSRGHGDGKDSGISVLREGYWASLGLSYSPGDLEMGKNSGISVLCGDTGNSQDSPVVLGTWGWEDFSAV